MNETNPVSNELYRASWDSFLIAVLFALMGVANLLSGQGLLMAAFGGFQLLLSYLNFNSGFQRRNMAKNITLVPKEAEQQSDA